MNFKYKNYFLHYLGNEKAETYKWVHETFQKAMEEFAKRDGIENYKVPYVLYIDQD